jgi:CubicO group peptidase (beta-lactamase class C family)
MAFCYRAAVILFLLSGLLNAGATVAQEDAHDLERKVDQVFAAYDKPDSPGCALGVIRDSEFLYKKAYGSGSLELGVSLTPQSIFYLASVSKQFTAASVVLAAEQGYLSLDDDVRRYIPELPLYGHEITLRQMLHHTSGYRDELALLRLAGGNFADVHSPAEMLDLVSRQKALNFIPGSEYHYSNTNFFLMSVVIQRATGKPLSKFAEENIFKPLGMSHTQFYDDRTEVVPGRVPAYKPLAAGGFGIDWSTNFDKVGDGGLLSSVEDLLKWDRNFYADKLGKGTLLRELQTPGVLNNGKQIEYALGLFISTYRGLPTVEHSGGLFGYRTELLRFPRQKFSVICLCNLESSETSTLANQVADIYLKGQLSPEHPATLLHVDPRPFTGRYRNLESHSVLDLSVVEGDLAASGQHFKPLGPRRFAASGEELTFEFRGGKPAALTLTETDTLPRRYEKFQTLEPSAQDLAQYAGVYTSSELPATYRFALRDGHLSLAVNWQEPTALLPSVPDEFQDPVLGTAIVFRRDATGQIDGCDIFARQVRHIAFARAALATH